MDDSIVSRVPIRFLRYVLMIVELEGIVRARCGYRI